MVAFHGSRMKCAHECLVLGVMVFHFDFDKTALCSLIWFRRIFIYIFRGFHKEHMMQRQILVNIDDPETNLQYSVFLPKDDFEKFNTDENYANALLRHVKINYKGHAILNEVSDAQTCHVDEIVHELEDPLEDTVREKKVWTKHETLLIIQSVEAHYDEFNHPKKRKRIWDNIANDMISNGVHISSTACAQKWKNLIRSYKACKDNMNKSGRGPSRFLFFTQMDELLGTKAHISSPHTIDTLLNDTETMQGNAGSELDHGMHEEPQEIRETHESQVIEETQETPKRKNRRIDYLKAKINFFEMKTLNIEKKEADKENYWKKKLELEERKIKALEELVELRKEKRSKSNEKK